jgi:integrase
MPNWNGKWAGGRTYLRKDGSTAWVLDKMVNGVAHTITLDAKSEEEAKAELALFRRDPVGYRVRSEAASQSLGEMVRIDDETVGKFLAHLAAGGRTTRYMKSARTYLAAWAGAFGGRDLRAVDLKAVNDALDAWPNARKHRIIYLKSFCSFLEEKGLLPIERNPTRALPVPAARPEKAHREKGYTAELLERLYRAIYGWKSPKFGSGSETVTEVQSVRDVFVLRAKFGMHGTEVERVARGEAKIRELKDLGEIAGTIRFLHKNGDMHTVSVDAQGLAAAQRLVQRGTAPAESWVRKVVSRAAKAVKSTGAVNPGELRHSFITIASESGEEVRPKRGGVPLATVSAVVGHRSTSTTRKFYDGTQVPPMIKLPMQLFHPDDPAKLPTRDRKLQDAVG